MQDMMHQLKTLSNACLRRKIIKSSRIEHKNAFCVNWLSSDLSIQLYQVAEHGLHFH